MSIAEQLEKFLGLRHCAMKNNVSIHARQPQMCRRDFLRLGTAAAAFSIVPRSVLGGAGQVAPGERITLAGIGMGGQAAGHSARA